MPQTLPLKPIDADTIDKLTAAIDEREAIAAAVADVVARGLRNVYFVGAGGSIICSDPPTTFCSARPPSPSSSCRATSSTAPPPR